MAAGSPVLPAISLTSKTSIIVLQLPLGNSSFHALPSWPSGVWSVINMDRSRGARRDRPPPRLTSRSPKQNAKNIWNSFFWHWYVTIRGAIVVLPHYNSTHRTPQFRCDATTFFHKKIINQPHLSRCLVLRTLRCRRLRGLTNTYVINDRSQLFVFSLLLLWLDNDL